LPALAGHGLSRLAQRLPPDGAVESNPKQEKVTMKLHLGRARRLGPSPATRSRASATHLRAQPGPGADGALPRQRAGGAARAWPPKVPPESRFVRALALAAVLAAPNVFGALLSASCDAGGVATPGGTITCGQFDTDLGDLNAVTFRFTPSYQAGGAIVNFEPGTISPVVTMTARFTYGGALPSEFIIDLLASQTLGPLNQYQSASYSLKDDDMQDLVLSSGLDAYRNSNPSTFEITVAGGGSVTWSTGSRQGGGDGGGSLVAVTYDYTPQGQEVPEPATLALVGLGLAATAVSRKRRKRASS
jgi:hypothetical protein